MVNMKAELFGIIAFCCVIIAGVLGLGTVGDVQGVTLSVSQLSAVFGGDGCDTDCILVSSCPNPECDLKGDGYWHKFSTVNMVICYQKTGETCTDNLNRLCARRYKYTNSSCSGTGIPEDVIACMSGCDGASAVCPQ